MGCLLDHPELRFADADGQPLPPLAARVALKVKPRFQHAPRRATSLAVWTYANALTLEDADPNIVLKADPKAPTDRAPEPFCSYLDRRKAVLPPDLLLRGGLDVNGALPHTELGKAALIVDMFARCSPALDHVYYLAYERAPRTAFDYPSPLRQVFATHYAACSVAVTDERPHPRLPRPVCARASPAFCAA